MLLWVICERNDFELQSFPTFLKGLLLKSFQNILEISIKGG